MDLKLSALPVLLESSVELNAKPLEIQWLPVTFWPWMSLVVLGASVYMVGRAWSSRQGSQGAYRTFPREAKGLEVRPTQLIPEPSPQFTLSSENVQTQ